MKLQLKSNERKVEILQKCQQGNDERNRARDKQDGSEKNHLHMQECREEQGDEEDRGHEHAQSCQADRQAKHPGAPDEDADLQVEACLILLRPVSSASPSCRVRSTTRPKRFVIERISRPTPEIRINGADGGLKNGC